MKLQAALRFLVLVAVLVASTLVSDGGGAPRQSVGRASWLGLTEMKAEGVELAADGYEVGESQA